MCCIAEPCRRRGVPLKPAEAAHSGARRAAAVPAEAAAVRACAGPAACAGGWPEQPQAPAGAAAAAHRAKTIPPGAPGAPAPVNTVLAARGRPEGSAAAAALAGGDSLAAMEAFAALAARHEQARPAREEEKVELLNETSFDRRRQVAVYKNDGKRGHHMQARARPPRAGEREVSPLV